MIVDGWVGKEEKKKKKQWMKTSRGSRRNLCMRVCVDAAQPLLYEPKHTC